MNSYSCPHCWLRKVIHPPPHIHSDGGRDGYTLHLHAVLNVEEYTLHVHTASGGQGYIMNMYSVHSSYWRGINTTRPPSWRWKGIHFARPHCWWWKRRGYTLHMYMYAYTYTHGCCWYCYYYNILINHRCMPECRNVGKKVRQAFAFFTISSLPVWHRHSDIRVSPVTLVTDKTGIVNVKLWENDRKIHNFFNCLPNRVYRMPGFLSSRPNWVLPHPLTHKWVLPPFGSKGRHTRLRGRGWGTHFWRSDRHPSTLYHNPSTVSPVQSCA